MKIFSSEQIRKIDEYTIMHEPVSSTDLMERAATELFKWITSHYGRSEHFFVFSGPGNNGGDGLALARMLVSNGYNVDVYYIKFTEKTSDDWNVNYRRLSEFTDVRLNIIDSDSVFPLVSHNDIIIDAIFGSGLSRPVNGLVHEIIKKINCTNSTILSIDIPSGLFGEDNSKNDYEGIVKATFTLTFQFPKLSFLFAENSNYVGNWIVIPIGLDQNASANISTPYSFLETADIAPLLRKRSKFEHKGSFGHCLLISGSIGKMGATVLSAGAALRTGTGLITCRIPYTGINIVQCALPEAMVSPDRSENYISDCCDTEIYSAVGVGPGLGTEIESKKMLNKLIMNCSKPIVIDADALNIISENKELLNHLPKNAILTPHPKEFERLVGKLNNSYEYLTRQMKFSAEHDCIVVLKGAHTSVSTPDGKVFFNNSGNPGMATAGSGDVLTGIILSLLSQGYTPGNAAITGVFLHGTAGDIAAQESCYESIIASDIILNIGKAYKRIRGI
jgi:ADP-dependent NAD(P)H-hydrate dehydratase / NAD(P)H-hydrate epimerase